MVKEVERFQAVKVATVQLALCNQNQNKKYKQISTDLPVQNVKSFNQVAKTKKFMASI